MVPSIQPCVQHSNVRVFVLQCALCVCAALSLQEPPSFCISLCLSTLTCAISLHVWWSLVCAEGGGCSVSPNKLLCEVTVCLCCCTSGASRKGRTCACVYVCCWHQVFCVLSADIWHGLNSAAPVPPRVVCLCVYCFRNCVGTTQSQGSSYFQTLNLSQIFLLMLPTTPNSKDDSTLAPKCCSLWQHTPGLKNRLLLLLLTLQQSAALGSGFTESCRWPWL